MVVTALLEKNFDVIFADVGTNLRYFILTSAIKKLNNIQYLYRIIDSLDIIIWILKLILPRFPRKLKIKYLTNYP
jgi:hypothetical protein